MKNSNLIQPVGHNIAAAVFYAKNLIKSGKTKTIVLRNAIETNYPGLKDDFPQIMDAVLDYKEFVSSVSADVEKLHKVHIEFFRIFQRLEDGSRNPECYKAALEIFTPANLAFAKEYGAEVFTTFRLETSLKARIKNVIAAIEKQVYLNNKKKK